MRMTTLFLVSLLLAFTKEISATCAGVAVGNSACLNCKQWAECDGAGLPLPPPLPTPCGHSMACGVVGGIAGCHPYETTHCTCANPITCDSYDPTALVYCDDAGPYLVVSCPNPVTEVCLDGACHQNTCVGIIDEWALVPPACTQAFYCDANSVDIDTLVCSDGQYPNDGFCDPVPPPACDRTCAGMCADKLDCERYYICNTDGSVGGSGSCAPGTFDESLPGCTSIQPSNCPPTVDCYFATDVTSSIITTSTPTPTPTPTPDPTQPSECTVEEVGNYPFEPDCSQKYWTCMQTGADMYEYVLRNCLDEKYFNVDGAICDNFINVGNCIDQFVQE